MELKNKTIVITGGTSGIGYQMVRLLSPHNTIIVVARSEKNLKKLLEKFPGIKTFPADLSKPEVYETLAAQIMKEHPKIDALINNAAIQHTPTFLDNDFAYESIVSEINLNFTSVCSLTYLLLPALKNGNTESVIANINSGLALAPKISSAVYCATKGAMNTFSQSLSYQLEHTNIRVMQMFLPLVDTPMTTGRGKGKISAQQAATDILLEIEKGVKVGNIGKVKLLRILLVAVPWLARKIMKGV
ncbi:SDR family NAD(P)-dependent oxidoreductase [Aliikangiella coralliicola]|uniref:SDR family NAD(P)-dependent oxidoreductase n=2 Tax=Aliikangiella coralliicola TaxID=2592383 RepID=A0A545UK70_9GAMM|nr:SDR family NAD(P)-dependent oxidoreductase [Aliikangiella coralliicola]